MGFDERWPLAQLANSIYNSLLLLWLVQLGHSVGVNGRRRLGSLCAAAASIVFGLFSLLLWAVELRYALGVYGRGRRGSLGLRVLAVVGIYFQQCPISPRNSGGQGEAECDGGNYDSCEMHVPE